MSYNLKKNKKIYAQFGINAYPMTDPQSPLHISWLSAVSKMLPIYKSQDPLISNIEMAMSKLNKTPEQIMEESQGVNEDFIQEQEQVVDNTEIAENQLKSFSKGKKMKIDKPFNLKKKAQSPPAPLQGHPDSLVDPEIQGDDMEMQSQLSNIPQPPFSKFEDFKMWADGMPMPSVLQEVAGQDADHLKDAMKEYFEETDDGKRALILAQVYNDDNFPLKENVFKADYERFGSVVDSIKKIAKEVADKNKKSSFNLKTAQHKSLYNTFLWGPGQTRIDPFLKQPVSDWHIVERNKGFGLVVDDVWNIDYETIWRENIMDKYSRPYKDKDGNWVGGYIQKRFEVDKNIPITNNLQLKPGELRKPIMPQYGNTESRLQQARADGKIAGSDNNSKPFNWKEANSKKKRT